MLPGNNPPDCDCGLLQPKAKERPIEPDMTSDQILSQVKLTVDDETGVLFFRCNANLYMRTVTTALQSRSAEIVGPVCLFLTLQTLRPQSCLDCTF